MSLQREGEERGDAKTLGLYNLKYRFVCTLLLMCDHMFLTYWNVSLFHITSLKQLKTSNGVNLSNLQEYLDTLAKQLLLLESQLC